MEPFSSFFLTNTRFPRRNGRAFIFSTWSFPEKRNGACVRGTDMHTHSKSFFCSSQLFWVISLRGKKRKRRRKSKTMYDAEKRRECCLQVEGKKTVKKCVWYLKHERRRKNTARRHYFSRCGGGDGGSATFVASRTRDIYFRERIHYFSAYFSVPWFFPLELWCIHTATQREENQPLYFFFCSKNIYKLTTNECSWND